MTLHAEEAAGDFQAALDLALESLEQQVRRLKERIRARKRRGPRRAGGAAIPTAESPGEPLDDQPPVVVRRINAKPMSLDEALEQFRVGQPDMLVFTNARSRVVNVLRRRADGALELVEPGR